MTNTLEKVKEHFRIEPEHILLADSFAEEIFSKPSNQHSEMVERIRERLVKMHENVIDKI